MIINTTDTLLTAIEQLKNEGNLLYPLSYCDSIASMHRVSVRRLKIDSDTNAGEVYHPAQVPQGRFALTKIGLLKIDLAAGLDWMPEFCNRMDNGTDQFFVKFRASAKIQDLDGSFRVVSAETTLDYREGSIALEGLTKNDVRMRRMSIVQRAETAAKNRVRRDAIGVKPTYTVAELAKPFIILKLVKDVPQRYEQALAAQIFGVDPASLAPAPLVDEVDDVAPITKTDLIGQINKLYLEKLGHERPKDKASLETLSEDQLNEIIRYLLSLEDRK